MTYEKYLGLLVKAELETKQKRKVDGLIKKATLPLAKSISNFDFNRLSGITAREFSKLSEGHFLKVPNNIVFYGGFGVGKTHLSIAHGLRGSRPPLKIPPFSVIHDGEISRNH